MYKSPSVCKTGHSLLAIGIQFHGWTITLLGGLGWIKSEPTVNQQSLDLSQATIGVEQMNQVDSVR